MDVLGLEAGRGVGNAQLAVNAVAVQCLDGGVLGEDAPPSALFGRHGQTQLGRRTFQAQLHLTGRRRPQPEAHAPVVGELGAEGHDVTAFHERGP